MVKVIVNSTNNKLDGNSHQSNNIEKKYLKTFSTLLSKHPSKKSFITLIFQNST